MNTYQLKLIVGAKLSKLCQSYFGFYPNIRDVTQKLSHLHRINNPAPCDMSKLREHIIKTMKKFLSDNRTRVWQEVVNMEIDKLKRNPSKPLPLP